MTILQVVREVETFDGVHPRRKVSGNYERATREELERDLDKCGGNKSVLCQRYQISNALLYAWLKDAGMHESQN